MRCGWVRHARRSVGFADTGRVGAAQLRNRSKTMSQHWSRCMKLWPRLAFAGPAATITERPSSKSKTSYVHPQSTIIGSRHADMLHSPHASHAHTRDRTRAPTVSISWACFASVTWFLPREADAKDLADEELDYFVAHAQDAKDALVAQLAAFKSTSTGPQPTKGDIVE